jgi:superfamily II DNA/RNA helicase
MSFSDLGLQPFILKALDNAGYQEPTPVQSQAIPPALEGADLLVSSQTGSGKTAAFLLPSLQRLMDPATGAGNGPRIVIITPTRELALQVQKAAETYGHGLRRLRTVCLVGGSPYAEQLRKLGQKVDIVVATPGRLMDHLERGRLDFARLEVLVLDEADRMLDMGFIDDIESIVGRMPTTRQTMLFSATLEGVVGKLAGRVTRDPQRIEVAPPPRQEAAIEQRLLFADNMGHKMRLLEVLLADESLNQAIVFTSTKRTAEELSDNLCENGEKAASLHGDMRQSQRNRTLQRVREGRTRVLVATDVAARGLDVAGISHVINFDAPRQAEDYVHRIGRTGRAGRSGVAITLAARGDSRLIRAIETYTGQSIFVEVIPGLEPAARAKKPHRAPSSAKKPSHGKRPNRAGQSASANAFPTAKKSGGAAPSSWKVGVKRKDKSGKRAAGPHRSHSV